MCIAVCALYLVFLFSKYFVSLAIEIVPTARHKELSYYNTSQ